MRIVNPLSDQIMKHENKIGRQLWINHHTNTKLEHNSEITTNLAHEINESRDKNIFKNHSSILEYELNMNSLKDHENKERTQTLHYPYFHTILMVNRDSPYINSTVFHHLIINSHSNPNSHNLTKLIPKHVRCNLMIYRLNISER
jgi:hypothetical protein